MVPPLHLYRRDPSRNIARFYRLEIGQTLFGEMVLIRRWGRIGTEGRRKETVLAGQSDGEFTLRIWQKKKEQRGYRQA